MIRDHAPWDWYDDPTNADAFEERTASLNVAEMFEPFLARIPPGGKILDAGCGTGRDSALFLSRGYDVTAIDASAEMVRRARARTGLPVWHMQFDGVPWVERFDGVLAMASLLHLDIIDLGVALRFLATTLVPGGALFATFKEFGYPHAPDGRWFCDMNEELLCVVMLETRRFDSIKTAVSNSYDAAGVPRRWISVLAEKKR